MDSHNWLHFTNTQINKCFFSVSGTDNEVIVEAIHLSGCSITISGKNNKLFINKGVGITNGIIIIRGNNCVVRIGEGSTFGGVRIINVGFENHVEIGKDCLFSDHIEIWSSDTHSIYDKSGRWINKEKPIVIEDNVWIGCRVSILKGVTIGKGAIVGMSSVVTKDIAPYTINAGNPARCIKSEIRWDLKYPEI